MSADSIGEIAGEFTQEMAEAMCNAVPRHRGVTQAEMRDAYRAARAALPSHAELERDAARYQWLRKLKSGRPESQIALARVVLALREMPEKMDVFIDEQIDARANEAQRQEVGR